MPTKFLFLSCASCALLISFFATAAEGVKETQQEHTNPIQKWFVLEPEREKEDEDEGLDGYVFEDAQNDGEEESKPITSGFECYDYTHDFDRVVCLDKETSVLMDNLQRQYSLRLASVPLSEHSIIQRQQRIWDADARFRCGIEMICIRSLIQERILELIDAPIIYRANLILNPEAPPITIAVTGRKTKQKYALHRILHLQVNQETGKETIAASFDLYRFMRSQYFELPHPSPKPFLIDANFDGWLDLLYLTRGFAKGIDRLYLLYNPEKGSFTTSGLLNGIKNPLFIDEHKIIGSPWQSDQNYGLDYFRYKKNKLVRDIRVIYQQSVNEDGTMAITMTTYSNRTGRMVKRNTVPVTLEQVGDLPSVYTSPPEINRAAGDNGVRAIPLKQF